MHRVAQAKTWQVLKPHLNVRVLLATPALILLVDWHDVSDGDSWCDSIGQTLITEMIFPSLCYNNDDDELWHNDPYEFVRVKYGNALYCLVLYCIVLYCIVLYCIVLHC
jgi:hypothetical protein